MTRKRGTATKAALIASLAVAFGVGSSALATTPPSEPSGGGGECPRDIAAAAAAETTAPRDDRRLRRRRQQPLRRRRRQPLRRRPLRLGPRLRRRRCPRTSPSSTPSHDQRHQPAASRQPAAGWHAAPVRRLARRELEPATTSTATSSTSRQVRPADGVLPVADRRRAAAATINPDFVLGLPGVRGRLTLTYTLNPEAVWHSGEPITAADWQAAWNALNGINPEFQVVSTEGYDLITLRRAGRRRVPGRSSTSASRTRTTRRCSRRSSPAEAVADPETFNTGMDRPDQQRLVHRSVRGRNVRRRRPDRRAGAQRHVVGRRAAARLASSSS